jgi:hypothetical protein
LPSRSLMSVFRVVSVVLMLSSTSMGPGQQVQAAAGAGETDATGNFVMNNARPSLEVRYFQSSEESTTASVNSTTAQSNPFSERGPAAIGGNSSRMPAAGSTMSASINTRWTESLQAGPRAPRPVTATPTCSHDRHQLLKGNSKDTVLHDIPSGRVLHTSHL